MKKLLAKQALTVRSSREGNVTVNLLTGERLPYSGSDEVGTLFFRRNRLRKVLVVGRENSLRDLSSLQERLYGNFSPRQAQAGAKLALQTYKDQASATRRDLRSLPTLTIDGPDSRDLDDAISAELEPNGRARVWVHIADVAAQLPKHHGLSRHAAKVTTSVYWPDRSVPMLPRELSEARFSLLPGEERLALTVEAVLQDGVVESYEVYPSLIKSNSRFSYDEINEYLTGRAKIEPAMAKLIDAASWGVKLDKDYYEESREYKYVVQDGRAVSYTMGVQGPSNKLIEHLMVMANVQMGLFLRESNRPALYRAHRLLDPAKVEKALAQVRTFLDLPPNCSLEEARAMVQDLTHPKQERLVRMLEWVTPPAQYQVEPEAHEGLDVEVYAHFTSPIRRQADLVNHRAIHALLAGKRSPYSTFTLRRMAKRINVKNWEAKRLSRLMDDRFLASNLDYLKDQGQYRGKVEATVETFTMNGAFCSFGHGKQGFLYLDQLGPGELNEELTRFVGKYRTVELGDTVPVSVGRADLARGRVGLRLWRDRDKSRHSSNSRSRAKSASPQA